MTPLIDTVKAKHSGRTNIHECNKKTGLFFPPVQPNVKCKICCEDVRLHLFYRLSNAFTLLCFSVYSTLKMEVICSSETYVIFQRTTRHYIPEENTVHKLTNSMELSTTREATRC
jgi:hypothetical protein